MLTSIVASFVLVPSKITMSIEPGTVSPLQFAASDQLLVAPPPSHVTLAAEAWRVKKKDAPPATMSTHASEQSARRAPRDL